MNVEITRGRSDIYDILTHHYRYKIATGYY
jgi:hypothetical protein